MAVATEGDEPDPLVLECCPRFEGETVPEAAALIMGLILERPLCLDCLAEKSNVTSIAVERVLATVGTVMQVHRQNDRCRACGETKEVVSFDRPTE